MRMYSMLGMERVSRTYVTKSSRIIFQSCVTIVHGMKVLVLSGFPYKSVEITYK